MNEPIYSIVAMSDVLPASALMCTKRLTGLSLAEVKSRVASGAPLVTCGCTDDDGLELIVRIHDSLDGEGVETRVFRGNRPEPYEFLLNLLETHRQIDEEDCWD